MLSPVSGDLDITEALTIDGNGSTIDAAMLDRIFDIQGSFTVTINALTIKNGVARGLLSLGGGLFIRGATVVLNNSVVRDNRVAVEAESRDDGGGIAVLGSFDAATGIATLASLTLNGTSVFNNTATSGGGIVCVLCALTVTEGVLNGQRRRRRRWRRDRSSSDTTPRSRYRAAHSRATPRRPGAAAARWRSVRMDEHVHG